MAARARPAVADERQPDTTMAPEVLGPDEPKWLWESLRYQFWRPEDFAHGFRRVHALRPEQREALATWWSLIAVAEGLGSRMYAAAFVRATEQHDSEQVRWSLMAMLRDELQHERLFGLAIRQLEAARPAEPKPANGGLAGGRDRAVQEAERCWHEYRRAIDRHGLGVVGGALLLRELVIGKIYEQWACGCMVPMFATAFRHAAHDATRHQAVLRALIARDWPKLSVGQRAETVAQVQATAKLLRAVMLDPTALPGDATAAEAGGPMPAGAPTADQRQEMLRESLLEIKDLQARYDIPFPAMPELAIFGNPADAGGERADETDRSPVDRRPSPRTPAAASRA